MAGAAAALSPGKLKYLSTTDHNADARSAHTTDLNLVGPGPEADMDLLAALAAPP